MNVLILNEMQKLELETLNQTAPTFQKLEPVKLIDSRDVLNADLLADMGEGGTWGHYATLLEELPMEEVTLAQFAAVEV
ncbi:MAG: hypothetical protein ACO1QB_03795 [Verrucomicrobiales bacterium]